MNKPKISKEFVTDILVVLLGTFLYSVGIHCFTAPHNIAPGGVTGVATMLEYVWGINIGISTLVINIPILLLAWKFIGKNFCIKTLAAIVLFSVFTDYITVYIPVYTGSSEARILASVFGGVLNGAGLGLVFSRGYTTGGTDVIASLLRMKFPLMSAGKMLFSVDLVVVAMSVFVFGNIESALFALIAMFATTKTIDAIVYGGEKGKLVMIVSDRSDEITDGIIHVLGRGATLLKASGSYKREDKNVIMTAVRPGQFHKLKKLVKNVDGKAFLIVLDASEIVGEGFKNINA